MSSSGMILDVPSALLELWYEFGVCYNSKKVSIDPLLLKEEQVPASLRFYRKMVINSGISPLAESLLRVDKGQRSEFI